MLIKYLNTQTQAHIFVAAIREVYQRFNATKKKSKKNKIQVKLNALIMVREGTIDYI